MTNPINWADFFNAIASPSHSSTSWSATNAATGGVWQFTGTGFSNYQSNVPFSGTITGITYSVNGVTLFSVTGASASVFTFLTEGLNGNWSVAVAGLYPGADTITGTSGADRLEGFAGNDMLSGADGNDTINGGAGNDALDGGAGDDTFSNVSATDAGTDSYNGGDGADFLHFNRSGATALTIDTAQMATDAGVTLADGTVIRNVEGIAFSGGSGNDTLIISGMGASGSYFGGGAGVDAVIADLSAWTDPVGLQGPAEFLIGAFLGYALDVSVERFEVTTGSGADILNGGVGNDVLFAGGGADSVSGRGGNDTLDGGDGDDSVIGGFGNDALSGGVGADGLSGEDGNDTIDGGDGDDSLHGGGGVDTMTGGAGNDYINAQEADNIDGGAGTDHLEVDLSAFTSNLTFSTAQMGSGAGVTLANGATVRNMESFYILSGSGNDTFIVTGPLFQVGVYSRAFWGNGGVDKFIGDFSMLSTAVSFNNGSMNINGVSSSTDAENVEITGGSANDSISTNIGDDVLNGGGGDDTLVGWAGNNILNGGTGNDNLVSGGIDVVDGGDGVDRVQIDVQSLTQNLTFDAALMASNAGQTLAHGGSVRNAERLGIWSGSGDDTFIGNATIFGNGDAYFHGGGGIDTFTADFSALATVVVLNGAQVSSAGASFSFTAENVNITGGSGADQLNATSALDSLNGGAGNDTISGGAGPDVLDGGAGTDLLVLIRYVAGVSTTGLTISFADLTGGADLILPEGAVLRNFERIVWQAGSGDDTLVLGASFAGSNRFEGNSGYNRIVADLSSFSTSIYFNAQSYSGENTLSTTGASLTFTQINAISVIGGSAGDFLVGTANADSIDGGEGNDHGLFGGGGDDAVNGGVGNDQIFGGEGIDVINGGAGDDTITWGFGDGADTVDGGAGVDAYTIGVVFHNETFLDVVLAGGVLTNAGGSALVNIENVSADLNEGVDWVTYTTTEAVTANLAAGTASGFFSLLRVEHLVTGSGADILTGSTANNKLISGDGVDTLRGLGGDDELSGGADNDSLEGGVGADVLDGGLGSDTASYAGAAAGVAVFMSAVGSNTGDAAGDTYISIENITGSAFADTLTGDGAANVLSGGSGDDTLRGGLGADQLIGAAGTDTADYASSAGAVRVDLTTGIGLDNDAQGDVLNGIENIVGSALNDQLTGDAANNTLNGADGADTLIGGLGVDTINGGAGADVINWLWGDGNGAVDGGADSDAFNITGNASANILKVNFNGSALIAAAGNTLANVETVNAAMGGGGDLLEYNAASSAVTVNLATGAASGFASLSGVTHVTGGGGNDNLTGDAAANKLTGGDGDDTLSGGDGIDQLFGGNGADTFYGGLGNDSINCEAGDDNVFWLWGDNGDTVNGGDGFDTMTFTGTGDSNLFKIAFDGTKITSVMGNPLSSVEAVIANTGGGGDWLIYKSATVTINVNLAAGTASGLASFSGVSHVQGGAGNDNFTGDNGFNKFEGGDGDDVISAGGDNDVLNGGNGNDTLTGGAGLDTINAGAGDDAIVWNWNDGADAIDGGTGTDAISFSGDGAVNLIKASWNGSVLTQVMSAALTGIENVNAAGGGGADWLIYTSTSGVTANLTTNTASGFASIAGFVNLQGGNGADTLTGDASANKLVGGDGGDTIAGMGGNDTLTGGLGNDTFVYAAGAGNDTVADFDANAAGGQDFLDITAFGVNAADFGARVSIVDAGNQTIVTIDGSVTITLQNVDGNGDNIVTVDDFLLA